MLAGVIKSVRQTMRAGARALYLRGQLEVFDRVVTRLGRGRRAASDQLHHRQSAQSTGEQSSYRDDQRGRYHVCAPRPARGAAPACTTARRLFRAIGTTAVHIRTT